ncbi:pantetheine-phosphate adenylyltransferase [Kribbella sp. DT2]|uniref:pantetheine-phosphate adenylyltransferase n=1 Tax=Kribbella sp. DT2 TaxID=3393427 RepID=UPI003CF2E66E
MSRAVFPGTFDPPTNGHLDVIARASAAFTEVIVGAGVNPSKQRMFDGDERVALLTEIAAPYPNVTVVPFEGLLVDFCRTVGAQVVVKGLRSGSDYDYELRMAQMNRRLTGLDTLFLPTAPEHGYVSSSLVKEIAKLGGPVDAFLPPSVHAQLIAKL